MFGAFAKHGIDLQNQPTFYVEIRYIFLNSIEGFENLSVRYEAKEG